MTKSLTFNQLRQANVERLSSSKYVLCEKNWSHAHWMQATVGELGELANILKKVDRGDFTLDSQLHNIASELADVQTYLDIMAHKLGIDLGKATVNKFNEVSKRIGSKVFITILSETPKVTPQDIEAYLKAHEASERPLESSVWHKGEKGEMKQFKPRTFRIDGRTGKVYRHTPGHLVSHDCVLIDVLCAPHSVDMGDPLHTHPAVAGEAVSVGSRDQFDYAVAALCKDVHPSYARAVDTLKNLKPAFAATFQPHSGVHGSVLKGEHWGIFSDGALVLVTDYVYGNTRIDSIKYPEIVFYVERHSTDEKTNAHIAENHQFSTFDYDYAIDALRSLPEHVQIKFLRNDRSKGGAHPGGLVAANVVEVILKSGTVLQGRVDDFRWTDSKIGPVVVYWRRID